MDYCFILVFSGSLNDILLLVPTSEPTSTKVAKKKWRHPFPEQTSASLQMWRQPMSENVCNGHQEAQNPFLFYC